MTPPIVDMHLDLAWVAETYRRDLRRPIAEVRTAAINPDLRAMASLPALGGAGIAVVGASLFVEPAASWLDGVYDGKDDGGSRYSTSAEADEAALRQLELYESWEAEGAAPIIRTVRDLESHLDLFARDAVPGLVLLMEGADPIESPDRLPMWVDRGVRLIGLTWGSTMYAGGTGSNDGLTAAGRDLLAGMHELGVILDIAHLAERAVWEALDGPVHAACATHCNPRATMAEPGRIPPDRHLSDEVIAAVAAPRGTASRSVVGSILLADFIDPTWVQRGERPPLDRVVAQMARVAAIAGWESVGLGSDVDAGVGAEGAAAGLETVADWPALGDLLPPVERDGVMGGNWLRFLRETLPA